MSQTLNQTNNRQLSSVNFKPKPLDINISKSVLVSVLIGILLASLLALSYFNGMLFFKEIASAAFIIGLVCFVKIASKN